MLMVRQASTLTAACLPGATKNCILATKFRILVARSRNYNLTECFLSLIDVHFPKSNPLHKILNTNTIKLLSYSCKSKAKTLISNHNKSELNKCKQTDVNKNNYCNF